MPAFDAVLIDMDGVIVDSMPLHREVWAAFARLLGLTTSLGPQALVAAGADWVAADFTALPQGLDLPARGGQAP